MKKKNNINDVYLLHVLRHSFYIPFYGNECYYKDILLDTDYYILALKKESGTYIDLNNLKKFKGKEKIGLGYIDYIDKAIPLKNVINNENILNNQEVKNLFATFVIDNNDSVLKIKKRNRRKK